MEMMLSGRLFATNKLLPELFALLEATASTLTPWDGTPLVPSPPGPRLEAAKVAEGTADREPFKIPAARIADENTDADCAEMPAATFVGTESSVFAALSSSLKIVSNSAVGKALPER